MFLEFLEMKKSEVLSACIIKLEESMSKSAETIKQFVQDFLDGKLKQHLLNQDLPEDWDKEPVKVLVASNFDSIALDPEKDGLVEFYNPWCAHCKQLIPIYDKVAEHFEGNDNVVIARIDATANELERMKVTSFPTIKLHKKGDNSVFEYNGHRTFEAITKFVESGGEEEPEKPVEEEHEDADAVKRDEL